MELVWSFHDNMETSVRVDGELLEEFEVTMACDKGARWPLFYLTYMLVLLLSGGQKQLRTLLMLVH